MEALLQANGPQTDVLIPHLSYKLGDQAQYILARRHSQNHAQTNICSPATVKLLSVAVGSSTELVDPQSIILSFLLTNKSQTLPLFPCTTGAHCLFSLSVKMSGTEV